MDEHATFLKAIIARPDDDGPRLYFADFLEGTAGMVPCSQCVGGWIGCVFRDADGERSRTSKAKCNACHGTGEVSNGHAERAEFIRVQCQLAEHERAVKQWRDGRTTAICPPGFLIHSKREALRRRERELWESRRPNGGWVIMPDRLWPELQYNLPTDAIAESRNPTLLPRVIVRRGFVDSLTCIWPDFRTHAAAIMAATPLRRVRLATRPNYDRGAEVYMGSDGHTLKWLARKFPGIEFELPAATDGETATHYLNGGRREYRVRYYGHGETRAETLAVGIPRMGDVHPHDMAAVVTQIRTTRTYDPQLWDVEVVYSTSEVEADVS